MRPKGVFVHGIDKKITRHEGRKKKRRTISESTDDSRQESQFEDQDNDDDVVVDNEGFSQSRIAEKK
jgi:hypothetical protein